MPSFPFLPRTISLADRHSGIHQGTGRCRCSHSTGAITADTVQIERSGCSGTSADSEHLYSITHSWAYVCLLAGLANRDIAGHPVGRARDAGLVLSAFVTLDFPLADVRVFHTDRGGGFDDTRIDELLRVFGIKGSLPRKGNPYDNAVVESTDRLLKKELVYRNRYATVGQPRHDPDDYVWWSDGQRLHSTLGYRNPKEFTEQGLVL